MTKSEIFKKAWNLARRGQELFGGKVSEYFAESLRIVYQNVRTTAFLLEVASGSRKHKSWVAKVTGEDKKWGFKREFVDAKEPGVYELEDGVYNFKNAERNYQQYLVIRNGKAVEIEKEEVLLFVA